MEASHTSCIVRSSHQDPQAVSRHALCSAMRGPHTEAIARPDFRQAAGVLGQGTGRQQYLCPPLRRRCCTALSSVQSRVCSRNRVERRRSPCWEKGLHQGHLVSPRGAWGDCHLSRQHGIAMGHSLLGLHTSLGKILLLVNTPLPNICTSPESRGLPIFKAAPLLAPSLVLSTARSPCPAGDRDSDPLPCARAVNQTKPISLSPAWALVALV